MIEFKNPKLAKYILDKNAILLDGKKVVKEIETLDRKIKVFEDKEKVITAKVKPSAEIEARGVKLVDEINAKTKELEALGKEIEEQKLAAVPEEMKTEHLDLLKQREKKERDLGKLALKVQKIKDRMIPIVQKEVKPLLKTEFDDIETAEVKGDVVVIKTFNHLEDFKAKFKRR